MKTKLRFLFVLLTMLWWGATMYAESVTFTTTNENLISSQDEITLSHTGSLQTNNLKIARGQTLTISTSTRYIQTIEMTLRSGDTYTPQYVTANTGSTNYDDTNKKYTWTGIAKNIVFSNSSASDAKDFRPVSITVTYTTTDPSSVSDATVQTYPYTWDFNNTASLWTSSLEQLNLFTDQWSHITDNGDNEYRPKVEHTNWGYNIDIIKGLRFGNTNIYSPCLDYLRGQVYVLAGTSIKIPEVKAGQKIRVTGAIFDLSVDNATDNGDGSYTCNSNGNVTLTFGADSWIKTISVLKTDVTLSLRQGSEATKFVGAPGAGLRIQVTPDAARIDELFSVSSNENPSVMTIIPSTSYNDYYRYWITPGEAGTTKAILHYAGNDVYNPTDLEVTLTVVKNNQVISFNTSATINYSDYSGKTGDERYQNVATSNVPEHAGTITYSSSANDVATVDASTGYVNVLNSGTTTITATATGDASYASATTSYVLTINGSSTPTLTWVESGTTFPGLEGTTLAHNSEAWCYATVSGTSAEVQYRSSNTRIATVTTENKAYGETTVTACKVTATGNGPVTIYAYVKGKGDVNPAEIAYHMTATGGVFTMEFKPNSGTINVGRTITPHVDFPTVALAEIKTITASSDNTSVATIDADLLASGKYVLKGDNVDALLPVITGVSAGTAHITVRFTSDEYQDGEATYTVTVVNNQDVNFYWSINGSASGTSKTITMYEGDFIPIPEITGNSNGNNDYSLGANRKYAYEIRQGTLTMNGPYDSDPMDFKLGEGVPNYSVGDESKALVFYCKGKTHKLDALMVYGRAAGTTYLRATDSQTGNSCSDITLVIKPKSGVETAESSAIGQMSYPYTWDFTNMDMTDIIADASAEGNGGAYWKEYDTNTYMADGIMNIDLADSDDDGKLDETINKVFTANDKYLKQFSGLKIDLAGRNYVHDKNDRFRIAKNGSYILFIGGTHWITLPTLDATKVKTGDNAVKLFLKVKSNGNGVIESNGTPAKIENISSDEQIKVIDFTNAKGEMKVGFDKNVTVYWMAVSTEAKPINQQSNTSYPAATYSYPKDLDFGKSLEANNTIVSGSNVKAYYASNCSGSTVTMTQTEDAVYRDQGLLLKCDANKAGTFYMVANAQNEDDYETNGKPSSISTNLLVATSSSNVAGQQIPSQVTKEGKTWSNFLLSYRYKKYDGDSPTTGYINTSDWAFYRIHGSSSITPVAPVNMAYLQAEGDSYFYDPVSSSRVLQEETTHEGNNDLNSLIYINYINRDGTFETTTIKNVNADEKTKSINSGTWYTLQGVPVKAPALGGIYIHNGRKVVIK